MKLLRRLLFLGIIAGGFLIYRAVAPYQGFQGGGPPRLAWLAERRTGMLGNSRRSREPTTVESN